MTITEARKLYEIPDYIIDEYERLHFSQKAGKENHIWECNEQDLEYLGIMTTLHQIGFEANEVGQYMNLLVKGAKTKSNRLKMLNQKRDQFMDKIHLQEGQVDLLDYLRYEVQKESENTN